MRCKFNGRGPGTFIEQLILDSGRIGSKPFIHACLHEGLNLW